MYTGGVPEGTAPAFATTSKRAKKNKKGMEIARVIIMSDVLEVTGDDARTREIWRENLSCRHLMEVPSMAQQVKQHFGPNTFRSIYILRPHQTEQNLRRYL
jgi:hypothetical protein